VVPQCTRDIVEQFGFDLLPAKPCSFVFPDNLREERVRVRSAEQGVSRAYRSVSGHFAMHQLEGRLVVGSLLDAIEAVRCCCNASLIHHIRAIKSTAKKATSDEGSSRSGNGDRM
jgi:hypothetical protein